METDSRSDSTDGSDEEFEFINVEEMLAGDDGPQGAPIDMIIFDKMETTSQSDRNSEKEFINVEEFESAGDEGIPPGAFIQIIKVSEDRHFELDWDALQDILLKDSTRDKPVVVVTIAGDVSEGMSSAFIMCGLLTDFLWFFVYK